jgi:hypothetical protein
VVVSWSGFENAVKTLLGLRKARQGEALIATFIYSDAQKKKVKPICASPHLVTPSLGIKWMLLNDWPEFAACSKQNVDKRLGA